MPENITNQNDEVLRPEGVNIVTHSQTSRIEPFFQPQPILTSSHEYIEFMKVRQKILSIVRNESEEKQKVLDDIVNSLLELDPSLPTGTVALLWNVITLGKNIRDKRRKRELLQKVVNSILEQIFDPGLEFKMTKKDILDAFEVNCIERDDISSKQISQIYVKVLHMLKVGQLRDLTYEEQLHLYVRLKIQEITYSRQDWELNGR